MKIGYLIYGRNWNSFRRECEITCRSVDSGGRRLACHQVRLGSGSGGFMSIFMIVFLVLMIAWFCGWILFHVTSGLIHILLVVAVVALILHFVRGRHGDADLRIGR
jgi:Family of unknown function (DUF5670)